MKKSLLAVLLAVAIVAPVFAADKGAMEIDGKIGAAFAGKVDIDKMDGKNDVDPNFSLGADFFYYVMPALAVGAGVEHLFNAKIKKAGDAKLGYTNIYLQAKYDFELNNDIFNNIYPLVRVGYGITSLSDAKIDAGGVDAKMDVESNGLYWAVGVGTTIKEHFLLEVLYFMNKSSFKATAMGAKETSNVTFSAVKVNIGYKFAL